jgi:membrane protein
VRSLLARYLTSWPGRVAERSLRDLVEVEIVDRSMTLAAQAFTSVFPILILVATLRRRNDDNPIGSGLAESLALSADARAVLVAAMPTESNIGVFGVVGAVVVVLSATSYSRALLRMYARVWAVQGLPGMRAIWRWIGVLLGIVLLVLLLAAVRRVLAGVPFSSLAEALVAFAVGGLVWTWVPWILLAGRVSVRALAPGGVFMAIAMLILTLAGRIYLPVALRSASRQFGALGVSFTYVSWLFVVMFALVLTTVVGAVIARDPGPLGRLIHGYGDVPGDS